MTASVIRRAQALDVVTVERIVSAAYTPYIARIGKPPGPMLDDYFAIVASGTAHVIEHEARVAGVIVLVPHADHLLIDNIAVDPAARGLGLGRLLLEFADTEARALGLPELRLYTHQLMHENIALYTRVGWIETARTEQSGYARVFMRKSVG